MYFYYGQQNLSGSLSSSTEQAHCIIKTVSLWTWALMVEVTVQSQ